jgi:uncharacterized membrane protein YkgB
MRNIQVIVNRAAWLNRMSLFVVYFWFGILKILGVSPAEGIVSDLFNKTLNGIFSLQVFIPMFGILECFIGIIWLIPRFTKPAFFMMCFHMFSTFIPMFLLLGDTWQGFLNLTLSGQYIVKNLVLIAASWFVYKLHSNQEENQRHIQTV